MYRNCPSCPDGTILIKDLLFRDTRCPSCRNVVGVHRAVAAFFSVIIFVITVLTTIAVMAQLGFYAGLLWFTVPVGALSYIKARFGPLEVKNGRGEFKRGGLNERNIRPS